MLAKLHNYVKVNYMVSMGHLGLASTIGVVATKSSKLGMGYIDLCK